MIRITTIWWERWEHTKKSPDDRQILPKINFQDDCSHLPASWCHLEPSEQSINQYESDADEIAAKGRVSGNIESWDICIYINLKLQHISHPTQIPTAHWAFMIFRCYYRWGGHNEHFWVDWKLHIIWCPRNRYKHCCYIYSGQWILRLLGNDKIKFIASIPRFSSLLAQHF